MTSEISPAQLPLALSQEQVYSVSNVIQHGRVILSTTKWEH